MHRISVAKYAAIALAAACVATPSTAGDVTLTSDPHVPRRRSKGEKKRNKRYRQ